MLDQLTNILIIEDDETDVLIARKCLMKGMPHLKDKNIMVADSLSRAQEIIQSTKPEMVFLDINLPDASYDKSLLTLKSELTNVPMIILTNMHDQELISKLLSAGAQDYLQKGDLSPEALRKSCFYALERNKYEITLNKKEAEIEEMAQKLIKNTEMSTLGEMASNIGHEINSPLMVIYNFAEKILMDLDKNLTKEDLSEQVKVSVSKIHKTVDRISEIIKSIKSISRDANLLENEDFSLKELINDALNISMRKLRYENITVYSDYKSGPDVFINCNKVELSQVFLNLISNSFDAIKEADQEEKWIKIAVEKKDNKFVEISFVDSGHGIKDENEHAIFDSFFTTKIKKGGTGLGLAIAKRVFKKYEGKIECVSKSKNTTFKCILPFVK